MGSLKQLAFMVRLKYETPKILCRVFRTPKIHQSRNNWTVQKEENIADKRLRLFKGVGNQREGLMFWMGVVLSPTVLLM